MSEETNKSATDGGPAVVERTQPKVEIREVQDPKAIERAQTAERRRVSEMGRLARDYQVNPDVLSEYINEGKALEDFQDHILRNNLKATPINDSPEIGMSKKEKKEYSLVRAMRLASEGKEIDGLEGEAHEAAAKVLKREAKGFFVPADMEQFDDQRIIRALARQNPQVRRALEVSTASAGGYTVGTNVLGGSLIELLRNRTMIAGLGARMLTGLQGDIAIPKHTGGATAYWLAEGEEVGSSQQTFGNLIMTPKRLVGNTAYTKQLLAQSSIDIEAFVRDDLMRVLAIAKDLAAINGSGTDGEPLGILNTTGIGAVTFGGAAVWADVVEFETDIETNNASMENCHYITSPSTRGKWKTISKDAGSGMFLWEGNTVNGYPGHATNQMPSNRVLFGNFSDAIFADWAGMDVVVDPYSLKKQGQVEICIQILSDFGVRHAVSFSASSDAGNQ